MAMLFLFGGDRQKETDGSEPNFFFFVNISPHDFWPYVCKAIIKEPAAVMDCMVIAKILAI